MPQATVLIPTHSHHGTLACAVRSALNQTVRDIEIFIVGDGVSEPVRAVVETLLTEDSRIRFFDNPKGQSRGELHRHAALGEAGGEIICYLSDDDLWFPEHVATMHQLLQVADLAHAVQLIINLEGEVAVRPCDMSLPYYRELELTKRNRFGLSFGAHTLAMYRKLPEGWRPTPPGRPTDHYMWQQFVAHPECRAATSFRPTVLNFPAPGRENWAAEQRRAELETWYARISDPDPQWRTEFLYELLRTALSSGAREIDQVRGELKAVRNTRVLRWHNALAGTPVVGAVIRWLGKVVSRF